MSNRRKFINSIDRKVEFVSKPKGHWKTDKIFSPLKSKIKISSIRIYVALNQNQRTKGKEK